MKSVILSLLVGSVAFADVTSIRLTTDANPQIDRAAVMIIKHESPAYSLTAQGQKEADEKELKEAEERKEEFRKEREAQKKAVQDQESKEKRQAPVFVYNSKPKSTPVQVLTMPSRKKK